MDYWYCLNWICLNLGVDVRFVVVVGMNGDGNGNGNGNTNYLMNMMMKYR